MTTTVLPGRSKIGSRLVMRRRFLLTLGGFSLAVSHALLAATFYVSPAGNDTNSGTSVATAWKTINKVNGTTFAPGSIILFQGGSAFSGLIYFAPGTGGTHLAPITLSSYDPVTGATVPENAVSSERATIHGGNGGAFYAWRTAGLILQHLNFTGSGTATNTGDGVAFYNDIGGGVKYDRLEIRHAEVTGFGKHGVAIGGYNGASGYRGITVTDLHSHHNVLSGMILYGPEYQAATPTYANENVQVAWSRAHNNDGVATATTNNGSGFVFGSVKTGLMEHCVAHDNGKNNTPSEGPVGLWAYDSDRVTIQFCESYDNRTASSGDGDGFDLDQNTTNCVLQYNYAHGNDGAGFLVYAGAGKVNKNNVVRYNISENDGRKLGYGAIFVAGKIDGVDVYGNTVYLASPTNPSTPSAIRIGNISANPINVRIRNNILVTNKTGNNVNLLRVDSPRADHFIQGNLYHAVNGYRVLWGGTTYTSQNSWLAAVTNQERIGGSIVAVTADPLLSNPGNGGTLGDTTLLSTLTAYRIAANSPAREAGQNLAALFGIDPGARDFFGNPSPSGFRPDMGAHERLDGYFAWAYAAGLPADGAGTGALNATPANDGIANLIKYALDLPPLVSSSPNLPQVASDTMTPDGPWLTFTYRRSLTATGIATAVRTSADLDGWADVTFDNISAFEEIADPNPDGDGSAELVRVRLKIAPGESKRFLNLRVIQ